MMLKTGNQLRAARALVGLEQTDVATAADLSVNTIANLERAGPHSVPGKYSTVRRVTEVMQAAGVSFDVEGIGVRLAERAL